MIPVSFSWTIDCGKYCSSGSINKDVEMESVLKKLKEISEKSGTLTLFLIDAPDIDPQNLQVQTENDYFLLMLGEQDEDEYFVRTYTNNFISLQQINILGCLWDSRSICQEYSIVVKIIEEFCQTGNVSLSLLK